MLRAFARHGCYLPAVILFAAAALFWLIHGSKMLSWSMLSHHSVALQQWVASHPVLAHCAYVALYVAATTMPVPEAAVITAAGGFLFGIAVGGMLAAVGASLGATILFLVARSAFAETYRLRGGRAVQVIRTELQRDGFNYLLALRLIPVFPFWLVNLGAAFGGMRLTPYVAATFFGILPGTYAVAWVGSGVGDVLAAGNQPDLSIVLSPAILGPLVALGLLSLLPVAWRRWKRSSG